MSKKQYQLKVEIKTEARINKPKEEPKIDKEQEPE